jgi:hypothetical protein
VSAAAASTCGRFALEPADDNPLSSAAKLPRMMPSTDKSPEAEVEAVGDALGTRLLELRGETAERSSEDAAVDDDDCGGGGDDMDEFGNSKEACGENEQERP